jgi:hypothetical protein
MGRRNGFALAATVWGAIFTLVSVYWGLGGRIGVEQLGATIQDEVARGEALFWLVFWLGATAKAVWTAIGWALWRARRRIRPLLWLGWATGIGLTLYGGANWFSALAMQAGVIDVRAGIGEDALIWYVALWEPYWLLGGLLFLRATWRYQGEMR